MILKAIHFHFLAGLLAILVSCQNDQGNPNENEGENNDQYDKGELLFVNFDGSNLSQTDSLVKLITGLGVSISNISVLSNGTGSEAQIGYFSNYENDVLEMESGIVLSTGSAESVIGPNDQSRLSKGHNSNTIDLDLERMLLEDETAYNSIHDLCLVEFDAIFQLDTMCLKMQFGSEEYPEFVSAGFHDAFALFITHPDSNTATNLAKIGENTISVSSINANSNSEYYISNGAGDTPDLNNCIQYDGITRLITVNHPVEPNRTYRLKFVIADINDDIVDSGIFIKAGGLQSK